MSADTQKLKELILHVSAKYHGDSKFGSTKLYKLVAFTDMVHFARTGHSVTGQEYKKLPQGHVATGMSEAIDELIEDRKLEIKKESHYEYVAKVPVALKEPDYGNFTPEEIATIDEILGGFQDMNNTEISNFAHRITPNWDLIPEQQTIPLGAILFPSDYTLSQEEKDHFKEVVKSSDWGKELMQHDGTGVT
jgi:hypothetical protein